MLIHTDEILQLTIMLYMYLDVCMCIYCEHSIKRQFQEVKKSYVLHHGTEFLQNKLLQKGSHKALVSFQM